MLLYLSLSAHCRWCLAGFEPAKRPPLKLTVVALLPTFKHQHNELTTYTTHTNRSGSVCIVGWRVSIIGFNLTYPLRPSFNGTGTLGQGFAELPQLSQILLLLALCAALSGLGSFTTLVNQLMSNLLLWSLPD